MKLVGLRRDTAEGDTCKGCVLSISKEAVRTFLLPFLRVEYAPDRTAHIALIQYDDGVLSYILAPHTLRPGDSVVASTDANMLPGNCLPLGKIPPGTIVHNIELRPGAGGQCPRKKPAFFFLLLSSSFFFQRGEKKSNAPQNGFVWKSLTC